MFYLALATLSDASSWSRVNSSIRSFTSMSSSWEASHTMTGNTGTDAVLYWYWSWYWCQYWRKYLVLILELITINSDVNQRILTCPRYRTSSHSVWRASFFSPITRTFNVQISSRSEEGKHFEKIMNAISNLQRIEGTSVSALDICPPRIFAVCSWVVNLNIIGQFCQPEHAEHNQHREQSEHGKCVMKRNTCLSWASEMFQNCSYDLWQKSTLWQPQKPQKPLQLASSCGARQFQKWVWGRQVFFKVITLGINLSKVLRGEGFVKLLDVDLIHIVLRRSFRICGNRNRMFFQASKISRDELIKFPNPLFIVDGELIFWWPPCVIVMSIECSLVLGPDITASTPLRLSDHLHPDLQSWSEYWFHHNYLNKSFFSWTFFFVSANDLSLSRVLCSWLTWDIGRYLLITK